jgi:hypothetical protein
MVPVCFAIKKVFGSNLKSAAGLFQEEVIKMIHYVRKCHFMMKNAWKWQKWTKMIFPGLQLPGNEWDKKMTPPGKRKNCDGFRFIPFQPFSIATLSITKIGWQ